MKEKEEACPDCGSSRIVDGRCHTALYYQFVTPGHVFRPSGLKTLTFSLASSGVFVSDRFQTCLDCGLLWNRARQGTVAKTIIALGTKATRERLGL